MTCRSCEFIHVRHLEQAADRWLLQHNRRRVYPLLQNWSLCLSGPLCILISGMEYSYHHVWSEDLWSEDPDRAIVFNLRRIPR